MKILIKLKPNSSQEKIEKINENSFKVWVKQPPKQGKANKALIKVLSDYFNTAKSNIEILKGHKSRKKIISIKQI
ncbi:MAG TPA: DUF167 domain-containing protein [Patescibacteria group bacterium]|nr:DUF167 domain-containing protein [Patescibacteria group bacterium]